MYSYSRTTSPPLHLPRTLARPTFVDVSIDAIRSLAPDLADVPPEYIRRGLRVNANFLLAAIPSLSSSLQKYHLPPYLSIPVRSPTPPSYYPTHILALSSQKHSGPNDSVSLFPIHALVFATHCANLPRLPPSPPAAAAAAAAASGASTITLPVTSISLPNPAAFPLIHAFIYTHAISPLLSALIPLPPAFIHALSLPHAHATITETLASGPKLHQLSTFLCAHAASSLQTLTAHAGHVTALWRTTVALGLYDRELWDAMDLAWEVVLGALNLAAAQ